jgi:hypothetical protein
MTKVHLLNIIDYLRIILARKEKIVFTDGTNFSKSNDLKTKEPNSKSFYVFND